ncbi:MAG: PAS domain-containing protein [Akkermansiaceae bacterium]|nr:PAS domain-containing protein [Verrucomicrobiales bacterium]
MAVNSPALEPEPHDLPSLCLAITEHAPLPIATVEGATHIVRYVNPAFCQLMDKPRERLLGKPISELLPKKDECVTLLDRVFRTKKPESHIEQEHSKPHPVFWSYLMWPVLADELLVGVMIQVTETAQFHEKTLAMNEALMLGSVRQHELTEASESLNAQLRAEIKVRKRVEEELRRTQAELAALARELEALVAERTAALRETVGELEAFSYSIAHDMRAPLRAMTGFARIVQREHGEQLDETGKDLLGRVVSAAERLDRLIMDVLNYSSVTRQKLELQPVDLQKLLEEAIRNEPDFQPPHAEIEIRVPLPRVIAHEPSLMQCANNLLSNAVKFVLPGVTPKVTVRSEVIGQEVRLWFEDNGIGIAAGDKERIFSLFGRLNPTAEFEGTGIGLAIVRKAVDRMGGKFGVESELGRGSRFWIQFKKSEDV